MSNLRDSIVAALAVVGAGLAILALVLAVVAITQIEDDPAPPPVAPVTKTSASAFAQNLVQQALDRYEQEGLDPTLDFYNSPESVDGDWYVFILEEREDGGLYTVAHATRPELLGTTRVRIDRRGVDYGADFAATTEEGQWVDYVILNPATCEEALKHSWAVRRGDLIFGAGWYEDRVAEHPLLPTKCEPGAYTVAHVEAAVTRYKAEGREAAIAWHSDPANNDGRWYTFIIDPAVGELIAHPAESFIGYPLTGEAAYDDSGYHYIVDLLLAGEEGAFVRDTLVVPTQDEINPFFSGEELKHYYAVRHDGLIFASGWYEPAPTPEDIADYTRLLVARALTMHDNEGIEAALDYYNAPESVDGERYVFVLEDREDGIYTVAHATIPDLVGTTRQRIDARGYDYGAAFAATTEAGRWVNYIFLNPETGQEELKHTWIVRRGDYLIGSGWYEPVPTQDDPAGYTRLLVADAVSLYAQSGLEAALDHYNAPESADGPWYVFVLEQRPDGIYTLAHPTRPERVGLSHIRIDARGVNYGLEFARTPRSGHWVDYVFHNPETGQEELKHTWIVRRGNYLFGSGWYEEVE